MTEIAKQMNVHEQQSFKSSALIKRLDRRLTEPLGVIDVRPFQAQSAQVPGWIVQRSSLLNQLQTRYGNRDNPPSVDAEMVLAHPAQQPAGERPGLLSKVNKPFVPTVKPAASITPNAAKPLPSGKFRVSRKVAPLAVKSDSTAALRTSTERSAPTVTSDETSEPDEPDQRIPNQLPELPLAKLASSVPIIQTQGNVETSGGLNQPTESEANIPSVMRQTESGEPKQQPEQLTSSAKELPSSPTLPSQASDLPLAKTERLTPILPDLSAENTSSEGNTEVVLPSLHTQAPLSSPGQDSTALPLVEAQSVDVLVQRQPENVSISHQPSGGSSTLANHQVAIAPEVPVNVSPLPQADLIWRKAISAPSPANNGTKKNSPLAISSVQSNEPQIARQTALDTFTDTIPMATPETESAIFPSVMPGNPPVPSTAASSINVTQIAEQVSRILYRKLTVECERRGMSR